MAQKTITAYGGPVGGGEIKLNVSTPLQTKSQAGFDNQTPGLDGSSDVFLSDSGIALGERIYIKHNNGNANVKVFHFGESNGMIGGTSLTRFSLPDGTPRSYYFDFSQSGDQVVEEGWYDHYVYGVVDGSGNVHSGLHYKK
jgi:hypothetical protein